MYNLVVSLSCWFIKKNARGDILAISRVKVKVNCEMAYYEKKLTNSRWTVITQLLYMHMVSTKQTILLNVVYNWPMDTAWCTNKMYLAALMWLQDL